MEPKPEGEMTREEVLERVFIQACLAVSIITFIFFPNLSFADAVTDSIVDIQYQLNTIKQHEIILYQALKNLENEVKQCKK